MNREKNRGDSERKDRYRDIGKKIPINCQLFRKVRNPV